MRRPVAGSILALTGGILALTLLAALLLGCGKRGGSDKTIRVVRNIGGREGFKQHFEAWKSAFEKANPNWKMDLIDLGDANGAAYYKTCVATGDLPEIVQTWSLTKYMVDSDMLTPIPGSYYEKFGVQMPAPYKGQQYNSQGGLQFLGIAVNKAMWADVGVTQPPATWDDLIAGLRKLKDKGHRPLVYGGRDWSAASPLSYALQVNLYDPDPPAGKPSWTQRRDRGEVKFTTDPTARRVVQKMVELLDLFAEKGVLSDGYPEQQRLFYGNQGAAWLMGCWIAGDLEPNKVSQDIEYWPIPSMTGAPAVFLASTRMQSGWAISKSAPEEKKQKALAVLEAFYEPQVYQLYLNGEGMFSMARKVPVAGPKSNWPAAQKLFDGMAAGLKAYPTHTGWLLGLEDQPPPSMKWERVMQEILSGEKDVDKLLAILDDEWGRARKGQ